MSSACGSAAFRFSVAARAWLISMRDERRRISLVAPRGSLTSRPERAPRRPAPTISSVCAMSCYRIVAAENSPASVCVRPITVIRAAHAGAGPGPYNPGMPVQTVAPSYTIASADGAPDKDRMLALYRALLFPRLVEERMLILLRQGRLSKWFSGIGQEAIAVGAAAALNPDDAILPMHRNLGVFTARGLDLLTLFRQLLGRDGGFTRGRDRTFHFGVPERNIVGMISHLGA